MLLEQIKADLKTAQKQGREREVSTLRFLLAAIHDREIELKKRGELKDDEIIAVIRKQAKERRESIEAYQKGARNDLAEKEREELAILSKYLPQDFGPEELKKIVQTTIKELGAEGPADFGRVMGAVMGKVKGRAEGGLVAEILKKELSGH